MTDQLLQPVIALLEQQGETEDQIANTIADLTQAATVLLYKQAMENFSDEDIEKIEACSNDAAANKVIATIYAQKMGTTPEEVLQTFLKTFVKKFLEEHE